MLWVFREAFRIVQEGQPGPVLIDLPLDVQRGEVEYDPNIAFPLAITRPSPNRKKVRKALQMLLEAQRPLFLLGGSVILAEACDEFVKLAEYLSIPMVTTLMGKGRIRADHPLYAGQVGIQYDTRSGNQVLWIYYW